MLVSPPSAAARGAPDGPPGLESTGSPPLDLVLGGGLPRGALTILLGPAGSGRTTLACQTAFAGAQRGQPVVVFTTLAEPSTKLLEHLRAYQFFEPAFIAERVWVYPLQDLLSEGEKPSVQEVVKVVRAARARWVVIDSLEGLGEHGDDQRWVRHLLYSLGAQLSLFGATTLLISEGEPHAPLPFPEMITADVLLGLSMVQVGRRVSRRLEVLRARGQAPLLGQHSLVVNERGVEVFPRLESQVGRATAPVPSPAALGTSAPLERVPFGLAEVDMVLGGGLIRQTSTVLAGSLGTGKTLLALAFALEGVHQGEAVFWLSFRETAVQLAQKVVPFANGPALRAALTPGGGVTVQRWAPVELNPDQVVSELLTALKRTSARRLIIDGIGDLERAVIETSGVERVPDFLAALWEILQQQGVMLLALKETPKVLTSELDFSTEPIAVLAENVILLQRVVWREQSRRVLSVLKMSYSAHDTTLREVRIVAPVGFQVLTPGESETGLLTELTRQQHTSGAEKDQSEVPSASTP